MLSTNTRTGCEPPFQPAMIDAGAIGSDHVKVIVSPASMRPCVPPLAVWTLVALGCVLSMISVIVADVVGCPRLSVATTRVW